VFERVSLAGLDFDALTHAQLIEHVVDSIGRGIGGVIITPNIDICRQARRDQASRALVACASVVVPDGTPLMWAARLAGRPLTERITGADLIFSLSAAAAARSWRVYLLGGQPGAGGRPGTAELAAARLADRYPGMRAAGAWSPPAVFDAERGDIGLLRTALVEADPKIVFVGLGFPKQEHLIARLRADLPGAWFLGCGAAIPFAAGQLRRAPQRVQRMGLEWAYRLMLEPRRLARRYLVDDLPFALRLMASAAWQFRPLARGGRARAVVAATPSVPAVTVAPAAAEAAASRLSADASSAYGRASAAAAHRREGSTR
jgi:N-acetylglucosaminyldiphosphoundecaprenol N-acetyl-beta-D-mannosaminyltransferase